MVNTALVGTTWRISPQLPVGTERTSSRRVASFLGHLAELGVVLDTGVTDTRKRHFGVFSGYLTTSGDVRLRLENKGFSGFWGCHCQQS